MWLNAPEILPQLLPGQIHLWRADLRLPPPVLQQSRTLLSRDERERADRFYFEKHRNHFIAGRSILRRLLGRYLNIAPHTLRFHYNAYGKPLLSNAGNLSFNLSHQSHLALYGFARGASVGVDVEQLQPDLDWESMASMVFADGERTAIRRLPKEKQVSAFFRCWTSKEAFIKTDGKGVSLPLHQLEVEVDPEQAAQIKSVLWAPEIQKRWDIRALWVADDFPGAVVLTQTIHSINFFDWRN